MKKISLLVCALFLSFVMYAQHTQLGIKGGVNVSTLTDDEGDEMGSRIGFHAGLLAHIHLSRQLAIQPEVVYSSQGAKYTVGGDEHSLALNYINIPLQLQYMFSNGFRLQTGPQVGFLASVNDTEDGQETEFFTSDDFKSVDFAWSAGLGYLSNSGLGVDARYNIGLSNVIDEGSAVRRNNVFQVGLFYQFR